MTGYQIVSLVLLVMFVTASNRGFAQEKLQRKEYETPYYAGLAFLKGEVGLVTGRQVQGNVTTTASADNSDFAYGLFAGMKYNDYFNMELRYQQLGEPDHRLDYVDASKNSQARIDTDLKYRNLELLVLPRYELGKQFFVAAELGVYYLTVDRSADVSVAGKMTTKQLRQLEKSLQKNLGSDSESDFGLGYGLMAVYQRQSGWLFRTSMQWKEAGGDDVFVQSLSLGHTF